MSDGHKGDFLAREKRDAEDAYESWLTIARHKSEVFSELIMSDERGRRFINADHHIRLHEALRKYRRLVVMWAPEFGKTEQLTSIILHIIGRTSGLQYRDNPPLYRGAIIGDSFSQAAKTLRVIKQHISENSDFQACWPDCVKAKGSSELWSREAINVNRPKSVRLKDPTLQALGAGGPVLGSRLDFVVLDDVLNFENTRTPDQRETMYQWFKSTVLTRLNEWGIMVLLVNAWHPDDLAHRLIDEGWPHLIEPALKSNGSALWAERWPVARVNDRLKELGPIEGPRKLFHKARDEHDMRFTPDMIGVGLERGRGMDLLDIAKPSRGYKTYTGVDLGVSRTKKRTAGRHTAETVFFTILVHPSKVRQVIDVEAGRWSAAEIMQRAVEKHRRFDSVLVVENNSAQDLFVQLLKDTHPIPVVPYTTTAAAAHPEFGLEKMGVEMVNGLWIIPCDRTRRATGEVYKWIQELYDYKPNQHPGDRLRAAMFAWEGARRSEYTVRGKRMRLLSR